MFLKYLQIVNYKNLRSARFSFVEGVNTIIGENDSGKSNAMTALRILLDDTYYYNTKRLKENDFSDSLGNWKGHWIILSAVFGKITSEDKETEVCAGIVPENENEEFLKSYIKSGEDDIGVISLFIRPQKQVRKKLSEITDIAEFEEERNKPFEYPEIFEKYQTKLLNEKEIDFNDILSISYDLVNQNKFIAENIAGIMRTILVDEYQDTNELQYKILSSIVKCNKNIQVTFVGDTDQAIYGGLGGVAKTCDELQKEFGVKFQEKRLDGCYRTTQRIVDYYSNFQLQSAKIYAVSDIKDEKGCLVYDNTISKSELFEKIAYIVKEELSRGIPDNEICIIAPQWWLLFPLSKKIKELLPNVKFDAPDITPIKYDPMNVFYLISKLLFTESGRKIYLRKKIASEIIEILTEEYKIHLFDKIDNYKVMLKLYMSF